MKQFTLRAAITGIIGLVIITCSSAYVALKMGALPWPTVFVTVLSMALLGKTKNVTVQEINVTHTLMSSGAMVAGGLAFTLPGLWILNPNAVIDIRSVFIFTVSGAVLGTIFSALYRKNLLFEQKQVYPIGISAYETLTTGITNGKQSVKLFSAMGFSVVFTALRDAWQVIPAVISNASAGLWISPMAMAIGAVIGKISAYLWLGGSVMGLFIKDTVFKQSLGIGIMLGTGAAVLIKAIAGIIKSLKKSDREKSNAIPALIISAVIICVLSLFTELNLLQSILTVFGIAIVTLLSGMLTGQSGINPMEVFGILVMLGVGVFSNLSQNGMFIIAATVSVACGLCGDVMNDLKSGSLLNTDPVQQITAEGLGGIIGSFIAVVAVFAMKKGFGAFGTEVLPAPQATAVATMAGGFGDIRIIALGVATGLVLSMMKIPCATLGLGIYLANYISFAVGLGAVVSDILHRKAKVSENDINLVSSGLLGGEGITGVVIAIISTFAGI